MALVRDRLVGRARELRTIDALLDDLDQGRSAAIEFVGEPGIGKTRLLAELAGRAEARGHIVLSGSGSEQEHDLPFSVFIHALDEFLAGLEPERLETLDVDARAELAHVFPSLASLEPGREVALQPERYRSHRAIRKLLEQLADPAPFVLVLDDLHWSDSASLELLGSLIHHPPRARVLVAFGARLRQMPNGSATMFEREQRDGRLTRIQLDALGPADAHELLDGHVGSAEAAELYDESGGNPFYLYELARSFDRSIERSPAVTDLSRAIEVPPAIAAALTEELALLSESTRSVVEGAAVVGDPFEPELAAAAAAVSEATVIDAIDELLKFDLIRSTDVPRRFRFRHPLVRRAVYEATAAGWRLGAHERCADALRARGAAVAARAYHVERSAREGDLEAVAVLREAGEAAARLAPASAARWFAAALRLLPPTAAVEDRVALLLARAGCLAAIGQFADAHADLLVCVETAPRDWRVRVTTACAWVEHLLGLHSEAHRHLTTALAELDDGRSPEAVDLMIELSVDGFYGGDYDAMRSWGTRAVEAATQLSEHALVAAALSVQAWGGAVAGDGDRAQQHCDEATELVDHLSDGEVARRLDMLAHLTGADVWLDRYSAASRHARRALEICRSTGQGEQFPLVVQMLGVSLWVQGKPLESEELFEGAVEAARLAGNVQSLAWTLFNHSLAAHAAGHLDVALATARASLELEDDMEPGPITGATAAVLASALLEAGHADEAVDLLLTKVGGDDLGFIPGGWRARFLEVLTRALLATGRRADAERAVAATQACADAMAVPTAAAMASLAAASLALDADEPTTAAERALAAAAAFEATEARWDAARARELAGRALAQAGDGDRARVELELAASAFDAFGSLRYRDQAERELRKLGLAVHRRTRPGRADAAGIESLTERERQVAWLVVDRKTNPQIAAELFLSQKTVETHLRNIFHKMDVTTRADLARAIERAAPPGGAPPA